MVLKIQVFCEVTLYLRENSLIFRSVVVSRNSTDMFNQQHSITFRNIWIFNSTITPRNNLPITEVSFRILIYLPYTNETSVTWNRFSLIPKLFLSWMWIIKKKCLVHKSFKVLKFPAFCYVHKLYWCFVILSLKHVSCRGAAVVQWLRCCATNRKVAGSIPAGVTGIFHWHKILSL